MRAAAQWLDRSRFGWAWVRRGSKGRPPTALGGPQVSSSLMKGRHSLSRCMPTTGDGLTFFGIWSDSGTTPRRDVAGHGGRPWRSPAEARPLASEPKASRPGGSLPPGVSELTARPVPRRLARRATEIALTRQPKCMLHYPIVYQLDFIELRGIGECVCRARSGAGCFWGTSAFGTVCPCGCGLGWGRCSPGASGHESLRSEEAGEQVRD